MSGVCVAGGGTGGHTMPGLAVADTLARRGIPCAWIGSRRGVEARLVPAAGIAYLAIPTGKLRRPWTWRNAADLGVCVPAGILAAHRALGRLAPRVVFATGGFVALPTVLAAAARRIPVVAHEQTAVPGLANRVAARVARRVALTFSGSGRGLPQAKLVVTGNPLRPELRAGRAEAARARYALEPGVPLVYVTGGAQGAHRINRAIGDALPRLLGAAAIVHQCGAQVDTGDGAWLAERRTALPERLQRRYTVQAWVGDELRDIYAAAALVVGRAGAGTVNECCQLGVPALYVPLPGTSGDEQTANATLVERAGGCRVLPQAALTGERLAADVAHALADPSGLRTMGTRAQSLAVPDAAERIAALLSEWL